MNKVILMGRLVKDVDMRYNNNHTVANFTLAVNRRFSRENQADFIKCVAFQKTAEFISKYFAKGQMMSIVGHIQTSSWRDQQGNTRYNTDVMVEEVYFAGNKPDNTGGGPQNYAANGNGSQGYQNNQGYRNNQGGQNNQGYQNNQGGQNNQGYRNNQGGQSNQGYRNNQGGQNNQGYRNNQGGQNNQGYQYNQGYQNNQQNQNGQMNGNDFPYIDQYLEDDDLPF